MHLHQASSPPAQSLLWHLEFSPEQALLGVLQLFCPTCASLEGPKAPQTGSKSHGHWGYAAPALTRCLHSPRLIPCLSQDISSISWGNFRGARHNKSMARSPWCNKKAIAGQDSSHLALDGTKQTSKPPQTLFISGEAGTTGAWATWLIIPRSVLVWVQILPMARSPSLSGSERGKKPCRKWILSWPAICMYLKKGHVWDFPSWTSPGFFLPWQPKKISSLIPLMKINLFEAQSNPRPSLRVMALATSTGAMSPVQVGCDTAAMGTLHRLSIPFGLFPNGMLRCSQWAGLCRAGTSKSEQEPPFLVRAHLSGWDAVPDNAPLQGEGWFLVTAITGWHTAPYFFSHVFFKVLAEWSLSVCRAPPATLAGLFVGHQLSDAESPPGQIMLLLMLQHGHFGPNPFAPSPAPCRAAVPSYPPPP